MSATRERIETIDPPTATLHNRPVDFSEVTDSELLVWRDSSGFEVRKAELAFESASASLRAVLFFQEFVEREVVRRGL